jgi:hypothetical protein
LRQRSVGLHLLDLGGDISGNGLSKLFLTIAAAFAEAERDRIRERVGQVKADQKARGRYLGGIVPFGFRRGEGGELVAHEAEQEAIREIVALRAQGRPLRAIADAVRAGRASGSVTRAWRASSRLRQRSAEIVRAFPFRFAGELDAFAASSGTWRPLFAALRRDSEERRVDAKVVIASLNNYIAQSITQVNARRGLRRRWFSASIAACLPPR